MTRRRKHHHAHDLSFPHYARDVAELRDRSDKLFDEFGTIKIDLPFDVLFVLLNQLELAVRHPRNGGLSGNCTRKFITEMLAKIEKHSPGFASFWAKMQARHYGEGI